MDSVKKKKKTVLIIISSLREDIFVSFNFTNCCLSLLQLVFLYCTQVSWHVAAYILWYYVSAVNYRARIQGQGRRHIKLTQSRNQVWSYLSVQYGFVAETRCIDRKPVQSTTMKIDTEDAKTLVFHLKQFQTNRWKIIKALKPFFSLSNI